jgi:hypothetical protein
MSGELHDVVPRFVLILMFVKSLLRRLLSLADGMHQITGALCLPTSGRKSSRIPQH